MSPTKEMLHNLLDTVDVTEYDLLYQIMLKFIPTDNPYPDELKALIETEHETEFINHNAINWN